MTKQSILNQKNVDCHEAKASRNDGFTLAEVLITLVIIGVIAAMTVPIVMNKIQEQRTVSQVKTTFSQLAQMVQKAQVSNGPINTWSISTGDDLYQILKPHISVLKYCGYDLGCFPNVQYQYLKGGNWNNIESFPNLPKFIMNNGTSVALFKTRDGINFWFDINGVKGPNQWGKDAFIMFVDTKNGKIIHSDDDCFLNDNGWGCLKWILEHNNTNYPKEKPIEN